MTTPEPSTKTAATKRVSPWLWAGLAVGLLLLGGIVAYTAIRGRLPFTPYAYKGTLIQSPDLASDFTLTASTGERVSLSDFRGKVVLIYFGYTFCPDACPTTLTQLKKVPQALGDRASDAQVLMVTVDPARDTPEVLREYLAHFDPSFIGLTGTDEEILAAATPFGIYYNKHEGTAATGYLVDHTTSVLAVDKEGYLRLIYGFETPGEDIAADVRELVRQ